MKKSAAIIGTGLIGTSIGLGLRAAGWHVTGWDLDPATSSAALGRGGFDEIAVDETAACAGAPDVIVLAGPPAASRDFVARADVSSLTIDTAGVKDTIVAANRLPRFVGSHPMAGREVSGPDAATASLFHGATWVLTTDGAAAADLDAAGSLIAELGARPVHMTAAAHDAAVALVSHLPQLVAASLVGLVDAHPEAMNLAAGSFRDLTRVAGSDPALWLDVLAANRVDVVSAVREMQDRLGKLASMLEVDDTAALEETLLAARETRRSLAARATAVRVALADEPGELAKVGEALSTARADVRDIQLRHAPYGGGGVLTISVRPGDAVALTDSILAAGLVLAV